MSLTLTASYVASDETTYAAKHGYMLKALDELVYYRYNGRSWLAFDATPDIPLGDTFKFGTVSNLRNPLTAVTYNSALETPTSSSLLLQSYSSGSRVIFVYNSNLGLTLNRRTVTVGGNAWWLGIGNQPERFERLRIADLLVENYTDPVAGVNTTFTYRDHWDRHGNVRIHNGNRFNLTVNWPGGGSTVVPPYGIVTAGRTHQTGSLSIESSYLPITQVGDRMSYQANYDGQCAGEMETAYSIMSANGWLRYSGSLPDYDTTSREKASFTNADPVGSNYLFDWIIHRGNALSVIWDKNTNDVQFHDITWGGQLVGFQPDDVLTTEFLSSTIRITSKAQEQLGHSNYEHDIIPISTNLNDTNIFSIKGGKTIQRPATSLWNHLQAPLDYGYINETSSSVYKPYVGGPTDTYSYPNLTFVNSGITAGMYARLTSTFPVTTQTDGVTEIYSKYLKTNGAIGKHITIELTASGRNYAYFQPELLLNNTLDSDTMRWDCVTSLGKGTLRQRFVPFSTRKYQDRYAELDAYGHAHFLYHPQDGELSGSLDKSGSQQIMDVTSVQATDILIEGTDHDMQPSDYGMKVYHPTTNLWKVLEYVRNDGWWIANRADVIAGLQQTDRLISWRLPRLIEHLNDLVKAINNVAEVYPVTISDLYKDPLPANCDVIPFTFNNGGPVENPWAIPAGWAAGRYDLNGVFRTWCFGWGVTYNASVPNYEALKQHNKMVWGYVMTKRAESPAGSQVQEHKLFNINELDYVNTVENVNGETYTKYKAFQPDDHRKLFGGASSIVNYYYTTKTYLNAVFSSLGVAVPTVPAGERYTPSFVLDSSLSKINGTYYADGQQNFDTRFVLLDENDGCDAFQFYIKPESGGSWIQRVNDSAEFRLIDLTNTVKRRLYQRQALSTNWYQWLVNEITNADAIDCTDRSPRILAPQTEPPTELLNIYTNNIDKPAYQTLTEIYSDVPVLLVCGPEPYHTHTWSEIPEPSADPHPVIPETFTPVNPIGNMFFKEVEVADMPITVAKIETWSGQTWPVWHCQIIQRKGTRRL